MVRRGATPRTRLLSLPGASRTSAARNLVITLLWHKHTFTPADRKTRTFTVTQKCCTMFVVVVHVFCVMFVWLTLNPDLRYRPRSEKTYLHNLMAAHNYDVAHFYGFARSCLCGFVIWFCTCGFRCSGDGSLLIFFLIIIHFCTNVQLSNLILF